MKWKIVLLNLILLITMSYTSSFAAADGSTSPCCEVGNDALNLFDIFVIIGGIIAVVVIIYVIYRLQSSKN